MSQKGQNNEFEIIQRREKDSHPNDFVLEKNIFSNIFEKDIRRVFIYKKAERLAKAIHLITPAFTFSPALRNRVDGISMGLIDAAVLPPPVARNTLSRELLALSSVLAIARTGGLLSTMNADLIAKEAQILLQEVAAYEEPHLFLDESPTLSDIAKRAGKARSTAIPRPTPSVHTEKKDDRFSKGHIKDTAQEGRRDKIISVLESKGQSSIKDISTVIRDISEKTVQRELQAMVEEGILRKSGQRRWSTYTLI